MAENKNYELNDLTQMKRKILKMIDQDRNKAVQFLGIVNQQISQQPQAVLLIGDKATQTLDNLRKHAGNMIKMYQIQKRKISGQKATTDIQGILAQIQNKEKGNGSKNRQKDRS